MSTQETNLKAIADAIREKDGTTTPIPAYTFAERIRAIETGGLPDNVRTITLTADPPEGGTVSGGGVAQDGMTVTVKSFASDGYNFLEWREHGQATSKSGEYTFSITENRELTANFKKESSIPDGYTEVEYISNPNLGYINLGINALFNTYKVEILIGGIESSVCIMGYSKTENTSINRYILQGILKASSTNVTFSYQNLKSNSGSLTAKATSINNSLEIKKIIVNIPEKTFSVDGISNSLESTSGGANTSSCPTYLFGYYLYYNKISTPSNFKLYNLKIIQNSTIIKHYIPCINENNVAGLYDIVGKKFLTGTDTSKPFEAGPPV